MGVNGNKRRVAITGMGVVSPLGTGVGKFWGAIKRGECGISPLESFPLKDLYIKIGGEVRDFDPKELCKSKALLLAGRFSQFAGAAAAEAMRQSGLASPLRNGDRAAAIVGSGIGGLVNLESAYEDLFVHNKKATHPLTLLRSIGSSAAAHVSIDNGVRGPVFGTVSACSSAAHAIGLAYQMIKSGAVDVAFAGATECAVTYGSMRAWQAMRVLSPEGCYPFSKRRNGTVLAEGAGILVMEDMGHAQERGATILAELAGFGMTSDAADMVNPSVEGPIAAIEFALKDAGIAAQDVDYINAHGTATTINDINETRAIKHVFAEHANRLSVSSTKSMHGHCLGAGGGIEAVATIMAIQDGFVPATIGFDEAGDGCDLDYTPNEGRHRQITYAMSNSFAFGGLNAVLVFGPPPR